MKVYESVCIVSPSLPDDDVSRLIEKITETVVRAGATVLNVINDGKKEIGVRCST